VHRWLTLFAFMIVMKFGGTSVEDATAMRRLVGIVQQYLDRQPLVAVSAMAKVTNGLLECAHLAAKGELAQAQTNLESIAARHFAAVAELAHNEDDKDAVLAALQQRFAEIKTTLAEITAAKEWTPRFSDAISANGELLSSPIVALAFRAAGIKSTAVDIRPLMRTNDDFTRAAVQFDEANPQLKAGFAPLIAAGEVPVTQGFIGSTDQGVTTTIGRGGSDYSAAIIGAALDAAEIQIWTDVDGILTTDPRVVAEAAKVKTISFAEAAELAYFGAKVLHPSTLLPAMAKDIPVCVCNSRRPTVPGTAIVRKAPASKAIVKAIAFKRGITVVNVTSDRMLMAHGFLARLFEIFNKHETSVDMVATSEVSVSMTLDDTRHLDAALADLQQLGDVEIERDLALICVVGEQLKYTPGVASRIFNSIKDVNVSMISHGASAINVSFIIADKDAERTVKALHKEFFSALDEVTFEAPATRAQAAA
jgi:aspartate kinase